MTRRSILLVVLATVVLAGCAGQQSTGTPSPESPSGDASGIEVNQIPGIENGTLTDATVLAEANGETLVETGARLHLDESSPEMDSEATLTIGSTGTYVLSTTRSTGGQTASVDYWSNESTAFVRSQSGDRTQYRQLERGLGVLDEFNNSIREYLAAGTFTVQNDSTDGTTVVLTADDFTTSDDGPLAGASSLEGRLVLNQAGQIQNLTVTGQASGQAVRYDYELVDPIIERASKPAWVGEVPETATLNPQLSIDVENESVVKLSHEGGDRVPANATFSLTSNDMSGTVTLDTALDDGETRYVFFGASDGELTLTTEAPAADETASLSSPISVSVTTADGAGLYSGGIAWESASAGEGSAGSSGSGSGEQ
ncbi:MULTISPECIES: hypothetical protein [Salinibaculum]|uniref:hypothetical protein n=1 Tax=Salinibaculum TaxID=2732368 RepID=UPI0030CBAEFE